MQNFRAWIPNTVLEIEDRVRMIKTIIKYMEFAEEIKQIKLVPQRQIH